MTQWIKTIRRETGLIEHVCEHGIGHPSWASADWMAHRFPEEGVSHDEVAGSWGVHGCDGCCADHTWQIESLQESVRIMHKLFVLQGQRLGGIRAIVDATDNADESIEEIRAVLHSNVN